MGTACDASDERTRLAHRNSTPHTRRPTLGDSVELRYRASVHRTFRSAFLPGTLSTCARKGSTHLWMLHAQGPAFARMLKERIAAFVGGVEWGQRLRNVREFADVMEGLQWKF